MDATNCTESPVIVHNKHWGCKMLRYHISHVRLERSHNRTVAWLRAACCTCWEKWMCVLERLTCFHRCMNARAHDHNPARQRSTFIDETVQTATRNEQRLWYVTLHMCVFTHEHSRTRRCTIHPRTLTATLTPNITNHCHSVHIWTVSQMSVSFKWMRSVDSLLVNKGGGRGSSWSSLDLETLESDVSSGKSAGAIAKDLGWPTSSVPQRVETLKRRDHVMSVV